MQPVKHRHRLFDRAVPRRLVGHVVFDKEAIVAELIGHRTSAGCVDIGDCDLGALGH